MLVEQLHIVTVQFVFFKQVADRLKADYPLLKQLLSEA